MSERIHKLVDSVLEIERQMRLLGLWSDKDIDVEQLNSTAPFSADVMDFNEWLQFVFLPQMKTVLEQGGGIPSQSQIASMAELFFISNPQAGPLIDALAQFDRLINDA